ncbi:type I methionyl aminopeptidase [Candidatus Curtissbacteria bacterium RBG_16_39_7]|uniref:Methionine aminopeptidase n=1 Tax=Candidatus Curtissbacteria bacterium RBG_16_39_7 TaxID=1797707 RepID=A0A1F5G1L2_9BACT|nr:MAG: type I methionyl aminopeptidase [Candidatus Curtissbacteria bacterium RBG_16_39_7]
MKECGQMAAYVMEKILSNIEAGLSKRQLDIRGREEIKKLGAKPSFMMVPGYRWATCITVNDEVVHGVPNEDRLKEGDLVSVDLGVFWQGFHTDMARTIAVGNLSVEKKDFLETGRIALERAIKACRAGATVNDISCAIQGAIESKGYKVVRALTGHGIGRNLHEEPQVPGFHQKDKGVVLKEGMTLAIEVIYAMGKSEVCYKGEDGWTIRTRDSSLAGLFEDTVAVVKDGPIVLTRSN